MTFAGAARRRLIAVVFCAVTAVIVVWMIFSLGGSNLTNWVNQVGEEAAAFTAAACCGWRVHRASGRTKLGWLLMAASTASWGIGQTIWCWLQLGDGLPNPFPSAADVGFLAAVPLTIVGVVILTKQVGLAIPSYRLLLDGLIITGSLSIVSWSTALGAALHSGGSALALALSVTYPCADVVVVGVTLSGLIQARINRAPLATLGAGLVAIAVSDSSFAFLPSSAPAAVFNLLDAGWVIGFLLVGLAALLPTVRPRPDRSQEDRTVTQVALPYLILAAALVAVVIDGLERGAVSRVLEGMSVVLVALVFLRQFLALLDNRKLTRNLATIVANLQEKDVELEFLAFHDALTGLANRPLFADRLDHALASQSRRPHGIAIMICDLDNFKVVNDTLGHAAGDEFLRIVSDRLQQCARSSDTIARLGGDEFAIVVEEATDVAALPRLVERLQSAVANPCWVSGRRLEISASIGVAWAPEPGQTRDSLMRNADLALYDAKTKGKASWSLFQQDIATEFAEQYELHNDLLAASLDPQQFIVHYQPIFQTRSLVAAGVEALVRWQHPTRGLLYPDAFIPAAEATEVVLTLGAEVVTSACGRLRKWEQMGVTCPAVAVNLSGRQFQDHSLIPMFESVLLASGLEPGRLTVEVTESTILTGVDGVSSRLHALKDLGLRIAVDDFGAGYSSLSYLRDLPIDIVKIDRAFSTDVASNSRAFTLLGAMVELAHTIGLRTVVEGVEMAEQLEAIRDIGSDEVQGYFLARPEAPEVIQEILSLHSAAALSV